MRLLILFLLAALANPRSESLELNNQQVIVFLQDHKDEHFRTNVLPQLKELAADKSIALEIRNLEEGLPKEITSTPAIVYQNELGRSIYAGRYAEFNTIKNFIRTSKLMPQVLAKYCKDSVLSYKTGRTTILAPLKVTRLEGQVPKNWNQATFEQRAMQILEESMQNFTKEDESCIQKTDRQFYLDIYPYLDKDNKLYLSLALYSQFSCIVPVYATESAISGALTKQDSLLAEAAKQFEVAIDRQMNEAKNGDAFSAVSEQVPATSWEELGLRLPMKTKTEPVAMTVANDDMAWPTDWVFYQAVDEDTPLMQFYFKEPLERYAGEVKEINGSMKLNEKAELISGKFEVNTQSLTMGVADFDHKIHKKYIKAFKFPKATFEFDNLQDAKLEFRKANQFRIDGKFKLMKYEIPLTMDAQISRMLDEDGFPKLLVSAQFQLMITDDFKVKGPDGPAPANQTMIFATNFLMDFIRK